MKTLFSVLFTVLAVKIYAIPDSIVQAYRILPNDSLRCEYLINEAKKLKGNFPKLSYELASKALFYAEQSNYIQGMAKAYNMLGAIKCDIGEFISAIEHHSKAYERAKFVNDNALLAETFNCMGNVAYAQGKLTKAIEYYKKSLNYSNKANNKSQTLNNLYRLGLIYEALDNLNDAYRCYKRSLLIEEELKNKEGIFFSILGIASVSAKKENYYQAYVLYNKALELAINLNILSYQSLVYSKLGDLSKSQKKYIDALKYYSTALKIADSIDFYKDQKKCYYNLALTTEKLQFYKDAYNYLSRYVELSKNMYDADVAQQIARLQMKFDLKSKEKEIEQLKYKEEERTRERNFLLISSLLLIIIVILLILLFWTRFKNSQKLKQQYLEIKSQKEELDSVLEQLNTLNKELAKSNEQITDSLIYAASLQQTILPFEHLFFSVFNNCMIFNKPKHLVSGDFAWIQKRDNFVYFAIADCTGHGLAGALVSIKGYSLLNQALNVLNNPSPSDILNWLNKHWKAATKNNNEQLYDDSMEIAILKLQLDNLFLEYSLANMRFVVVNVNGNYQVFENKEHCIEGSNSSEIQPIFTTQNLNLVSGDTIYLFTDGFSDQYGKSKQKLMFKSFLEFLQTLSKYSIIEQHKVIEEYFISWKGKNKQTDDILVIGIKV